jgi:hypothetical protein
MSPRSISGLAALSLLCAALAAPTSFAQQDLRNPDTRDAAEASYLDLRNPDTRDAAESGASPAVTVFRLPQPDAVDAGLDWGDAGIGAGATLGLVLLLGAGTAAIAHRRGASRGPAITG